jgi:nondiscriminating aspartyl-tRNA synthetase
VKAVGISLPRTLIKDIRNLVGSDAKIQGWVKTIRDQKKMQFLLIRDHTGMVQATVERSPAKASINDLIAGLTRESAVTVVGTVVENPIVKTGGVEILIRELIVESRADGLIPIDPDGPVEPNAEVRLNWRFLDLRRPEAALIFQVQTALEHAMREYWIKERFLEIHSPKLMGSPSEGGAEVFPFEYFGRTAYLAQSPQFYKQMAMAAGLDRVFEIAPVFRADPSFTARHATEFTGLDMEMSWIDSHEDVMAFEERWLAYSLEQVRQQFGDAIRQTFGGDVAVPAVPFPRIPMQEARELTARKGHVIPGERGDLDPPGERLIAEYAMDQYAHEFVFVTDYPVEVRPFYHMRHANAPRVTKSFDLLWKGIEVTTGAQREHRYDVLMAQAKDKGLNLEPIQFYLDFFKYGCPPHGGFGAGLARMLMVLLNQSNIREVTFLFRGPTRLHP